MTQELPQVSAVQVAIDQLRSGLRPVDSEDLNSANAFGRVLAESLRADRDSPALNVSAMDGFALRIADLPESRRLEIASTTAAGSPPTELPTGQCIRVFTGGGVPTGADCVVPREQTDESETFMTLHAEPRLGQHIRFQGENSRLGDIILEQGDLLSTAAIGAFAGFASKRVKVSRHVRVAMLNTGDELKQIGAPVERWQIRDSNGPTLESWLSKFEWAKLTQRRPVRDTLQEVEQAIDQALAEADAVILTGGVSMGDADFVPDAIKRLGGKTIFHRLPIRPGKPVLGAVKDGKAIIGLPGNPVSVAVTARMIAQPILEAIAGKRPSRYAQAEVANADKRTLNLCWHRLVAINSANRLVLTEGKGSGDVVALARSDGFVVVPPGSSGPGPWTFVPW